MEVGDGGYKWGGQRLSAPEGAQSKSISHPFRTHSQHPDPAAIYGARMATIKG